MMERGLSFFILVMSAAGVVPVALVLEALGSASPVAVTLRLAVALLVIWGLGFHPWVRRLFVREALAGMNRNPEALHEGSPKTPYRMERRKAEREGVVTYDSRSDGEDMLKFHAPSPVLSHEFERILQNQYGDDSDLSQFSPDFLKGLSFLSLGLNILLSFSMGLIIVSELAGDSESNQSTSGDSNNSDAQPRRCHDADLISYPTAVALLSISIFFLMNSFFLSWNIEHVLILRRQTQLSRNVAVRESISKSNFIRFLGHELKNPLHSLFGLLYLLREKSTTLKQNQIIDGAMTCAETIHSVVQDVVDMSRLEDKAFALNIVTFRLQDLARSIDNLGSQLVATRAQKWSFEFVSEVSDEILLGDASLFFRCVSNTVSICSRLCSSGDEVKVALSYDGSNICFTLLIPRHIESLFELFSTYSPSSTMISRTLQGPLSGSGLSMPLASKSLQLMGGFVQAQSSKSKNETLFTLSSPFRSSLEDTESKLSSFLNPYTNSDFDAEEFYREVVNPPLMSESEISRPTHASPGREYHLSSMESETLAESMLQNDRSEEVKTVLSGDKSTCGKTLDDFSVRENSKIRCLVVEDDAFARMVMQTILKQSQIEIDGAEDGLEALSIWDSAEFPNEKWNCILMDLDLPKLNGIDCTIELRKRGATIPIFALTANVSPSIKEECSRVGFSAFLEKPLRPNLLLDLLK